MADVLTQLSNDSRSPGQQSCGWTPRPRPPPPHRPVLPGPGHPPHRCGWGRLRGDDNDDDDDDDSDDDNDDDDSDDDDDGDDDDCDDPPRFPRGSEEAACSFNSIVAAAVTC